MLVRKCPGEMLEVLMTEGDIIPCQSQICNMQMGRVSRESMKEELCTSRRQMAALEV